MKKRKDVPLHSRRRIRLFWRKPLLAFGILWFKRQTTGLGRTFGVVLVIGFRTASMTVLTRKFNAKILFRVRVDFHQDLIGAAFVAFCPKRTVGYAAIYCWHTYHPLGAILHLP